MRAPGPTPGRAGRRPWRPSRRRASRARTTRGSPPARRSTRVSRGRRPPRSSRIAWRTSGRLLAATRAVELDEQHVAVPLEQLVIGAAHHVERVGPSRRAGGGRTEGHSSSAGSTPGSPRRRAPPSWGRAGTGRPARSRPPWRSPWSGGGARAGARRASRRRPAPRALLGRREASVGAWAVAMGVSMHSLTPFVKSEFLARLSRDVHANRRAARARADPDEVVSWFTSQSPRPRTSSRCGRRRPTSGLSIGARSRTSSTTEPSSSQARSVPRPPPWRTLLAVSSPAAKTTFSTP